MLDGPACARRSAATASCTLPGLIDVMEVAGTGDLRAHAVLPLGAAS